LAKIFKPVGDEGTGKWRMLHSGELHNLYSSPDIIRRIKSIRMWWAGHLACIKDEMKLYNVLVRKPEAKKLLG
jgi:hypothetical protein